MAGEAAWARDGGRPGRFHLTRPRRPTFSPLSRSVKPYEFLYCNIFEPIWFVSNQIVFLAMYLSLDAP